MMSAHPRRKVPIRIAVRLLIAVSQGHDEISAEVQRTRSSLFTLGHITVNRSIGLGARDPAWL